MNARTAGMLALFVSGALLLGACSGGGEGRQTPLAPTTAPPRATPTATAPLGTLPAASASPTRTPGATSTTSPVRSVVPGPTPTLAQSRNLVDRAGVYAQDNLDVLEVRVTVFEEPGGPTLQDVENDLDYRDANKPVVKVLFQEGAYGQGPARPNATLGMRGHSTRLSEQKSYRIRLDKDGESWRGQRVINLNKHPYDLTRVRNKLSFDYFKLIPNMTSLRTQFVHLFINGKDYGLYTQIEEPNKQFLISHGLDAEGWLYKAESFEFRRYPGVLRDFKDPKYDESAFSRVLQIDGRKDHTKLLAMLDDVNNDAIPIDTVIQQHFNRENYLTWLATNILMGNLDTNSQNFYLYSPTDSDAWYFLPWDYDGAWGFYEEPDQVGIAQPRWSQGLSNWWAVPLHRRFVSDPENLRDLIQRVEELRRDIITPVRTGKLLDGYHGIAEEYSGKEPDQEFLPLAGSEQQWKSEFNGEFQRLPKVIDQNLEAFRAGLGRPMPFFLGEPVLGPGGWVFRWDPAVDLQGDGVTYDFQVSKSPLFRASDIIVERSKLVSADLTIAERLAPGAYWWRVTARDSKDPGANWQIAFGHYTDPATGARYFGTRSLTVR